jgi:hypothetical protein
VLPAWLFGKGHNRNETRNKELKKTRFGVETVQNSVTRYPSCRIVVLSFGVYWVSGRGNMQGGSNMTGTNDLCVNKSQFVPVIFEPPCTFAGFWVVASYSLVDTSVSEVIPASIFFLGG